MNTRGSIRTPNASGAHLRQAREALGLTVAEVAGMCERSAGTIRRWERDGVGPLARFESVYLLCRALHIGIDELLDTARTPT